MVLTELVEAALSWLFAMLGIHGSKIGAIALALVVLYHGHSLLSFLQSATASLRIGFAGAALVGLGLVVAVSMGWISVASIPSVPLPLMVVL